MSSMVHGELKVHALTHQSHLMRKCNKCKQKEEDEKELVLQRSVESPMTDALQPNVPETIQHDFSRIPVRLQKNLTINEPGDQYEKEADRVAEAVLSSGKNEITTGRSSDSPAIQRQGPEKIPSADSKVKTATEKVTEAALKISPFKEIKENAEKKGKAFIATLHGKIITGVVAAGAISTIAAMNAELPMQPPAIPLDMIAPGFKVKLSYKGQVRNPTEASITLVYEEQIPKSGEKGRIDEKERFRAGTAQIASEQEAFREGLKSPEQRVREKADFERAFWSGRDRLGMRPIEIPVLKREDPLLQRKETAGGVASQSVPPVVHEVLQSPGQPLDAKARAFFEPRFGHDFGQVRVHTDTPAAISAQQVNAAAFTIGHNIVFGRGQYIPSTGAGRKLIAHELAHVIQQDMTGVRAWKGNQIVMLQRDSLLIQRTKSGGGKCGGGTCSSLNNCSKPDNQGSGGTAASWLLIVNIDIDRTSFYSALLNKEFGHSNVKLMDDTGTAYTYGFYPDGSTPNETRPSVPGCVHHPDTTHSACIDEQMTYTLSQAQFNAALDRAKKQCQNKPDYHAANYNCTTFVGDIVRAAGQSLPSMRGKETIFYQEISADNPNTLLDNVRAERQRAPNARYPYWNNPCLNRCEANFNQCIAKSRIGGMDCYSPRTSCLRSCPPP